MFVQNPTLRRGASGSVLCLLFLGLLLQAVPARSAATPKPNMQVDTSDSDERYSRSLFVQGLTQSYLEDYDEAITFYEKALDYAPGTPAILVALAEAEAADGNTTSALYYARQARKHAPEHPYYYRRVAELLHEADRPRKAADAYTTLLSRFPSHLGARLAFARLLNELDHPRAALRQYETFVDSAKRPRADAYAEMLELYRKTEDSSGLEHTLKSLIELRRDAALYRRLLGQLYTEQNRFDEAIPLFETLLEENPNDPQLLTRLKMLYGETDQPGKAEALWDQFSTDQAGPDQLVARARSLYQAGHPDRRSEDETQIQAARRLLEEALERDSTHVEALDLLGTLHYQNKRYGEAAHLLHRAIDEDPKDAALWERAAAAYLQSNAATKAAALADEGLLLFPGRYELLRIEAEAHLRKDRYEHALASFEASIERLDTTTVPVRERATVYAGLGRAHQELGHLDAAQDAYEAALNLNDTEPRALIHLAYCLAEAETDLDRALELAQRAVTQNPSDPRAQGALGWVYFRRGEVTSAKSHFRQAVESGAASSRVYEHYGDLHHALGNDSRARRYWKKALNRTPERETLRQKLRTRPTG